MILDRPTRFARLLQTDRTSEDLAVHHQSLAFRARLYDEKNEAPEEEVIWRSSPEQRSKGRSTHDPWRQIRRTNLKTDQLKVCISLFGRKFVTDLIQLISSTRPKFDIWPNRSLGRPKLEFGSANETFDVWPRPKIVYSLRTGLLRENPRLQNSYCLLGTDRFLEQKLSAPRKNKLRLLGMPF